MKSLPRRRLGKHESLRIEQLETRNLLTTIVVDTLDDNVDFDDRLTSLREAITVANEDRLPDTIRFADTLEGEIVLELGQLSIAHDINIEGPGASRLTIRAFDPMIGGRANRILHIEGTVHRASVSDLTLTGGKSTGAGGAIAIDEGVDRVQLERLTISNSQSERGGGGVVSEADDLLVRDSIITGNRAGGSGGGMKVEYGLRLIDSSVVDNYANGNGGGVFAGVDDFNTTIVNSTFSQNRASRRFDGVYSSGGGLFISNHGSEGEVNVVDSTFEFNQAYQGGGIATHGNVTISNTSIHHNSAGPVSVTFNRGNGGGLFVDGARQVRVESSTISGNLSTGVGGGIQISAGEVSIHNTTISGNQALEGGGAVHSSSGEINRLEAIGSTIVENKGGGIYAETLADVFLNQTIVAQNFSSDRLLDFDAAYEADAVDARHSFLGDGTSGLEPSGFPAADAMGNLVGANNALIDPRLGELGDNGGATRTHLPMEDSPVINAGRSGVDPPTFDQRGVPYLRVSGDAVDIGAVEVQPLPGDFDGDGELACGDLEILADHFFQGLADPRLDLNRDGFVEPSDQRVWLDHAGAQNLPSGKPYPLGDANLDGKVNSLDLNTVGIHWQENAMSWCEGNFDASLRVDAVDLNALALNWQLDDSGEGREPRAALTLRTVTSDPLKLQQKEARETRDVAPVDNTMIRARRLSSRQALVARRSDRISAPRSVEPEFDEVPVRLELFRNT